MGPGAMGNPVRNSLGPGPVATLFRVYLAGRLNKDDLDGQPETWRQTFASAISRAGPFECVIPRPWLNEHRPELVFGHDCYLIQTSDLLVVNAPEKLGVGTAQEMLVAKYFNKPVFAVLPPDSHHRRSNITIGGRLFNDWIHPFLLSTSDAIFDSLDDLCNCLRTRPAPWVTPVKGIQIVDSSIAEYLRAQPPQAPRGASER